MKFKLICPILFLCFTNGVFAQSDEVQPVSENAAAYAAGYFFSVSTLPPFAGALDVGYQFNRNLGLQAGVLGIWGTTFGFDMDTATIYDIAMRGVVPLGDSGELFGKLGVGIINGRVTVSLPIVGTVKQTGESIGPTFGLGFGYYFTRRLAGTIQYAGIYSTGSSVLRSGVKGVPMIGVTYHFVG